MDEIRTVQDRIDPLQEYARPVYAPLLARGISPLALRWYGVRAVEQGWRSFYRYPVRASINAAPLAWRLKAGDGRKPKYLWDTRGGAACADLLYGVESVGPQGHPVLICAGEPDVWLMWTLGLSACSFLCGESGGASRRAVAQLLQRRPSYAIVVYDHDATGQSGAVAVTEALRFAGLRAVALALPASLPPGGDLTDLYAACGHDKEAFLARLAMLSELPVPGPARPPTGAALSAAHHAGPVPSAAHCTGAASCAANRARTAAPLRRHAPASRAATVIARFKAEHDIADVVAQAIPLKRHQGGRYLTGCCPFHPDRHPSFVVWPELGKFRCYGCGEHWWCSTTCAKRCRRT